MAAGTSDKRFRLSLRTKIVLLVVAVLAVVLFAVSLVILLYQSRSVRIMFDEELERRLDYVARELAEGRDRWTSERMSVLALEQSNYVFFEYLRIAVFDENGELVMASVDAFEEPISGRLAELAGMANAQLTLATANVLLPNHDQHDSYRLACKSFETVEGERYSLCLVTSDKYAARAVRYAAFVLLLAIPASLVVVGVATWYIAGLAVAPLKHFRQLALEIEPDHLPKSVDLHSSSAEVARLQSELDQAMGRIAAGYQSQYRFLTNISHELKTPISVILAEAEALASSPEMPGEARTFMKSTAEEMRRLGNLIESFLQLSRVREADQGRIDRRLISGNEVLMDAVAHCLSYARQMEVDLQPTLIEGDSEPLIECEPELLRTALDNLIRNAIRFTPAGEQVRVIGRLADGQVRFLVRDAGPGIPESQLESIFDRFSQLDNGNGRGRGTGLGLQIALGIAELHEGTINVRNRDSGGCEFELELPLHRTAGIETDRG